MTIVAFNSESFSNALYLSDGQGVMISQTQLVQSGVIEILAPPESQFTK